MNSYFLYNTIGGFTELSTSNQYIFTDTTSNDILIHTDLSNQNILLGTDSNDTSALHIAQAEITFNRNLKLNSNLGLGNDYSEKFVLSTGNAKFTSNIYVMNSIGLGTSNINHLFTLLGPSNNIEHGPNFTAYFSEDTPTSQETTRPVFEIINWDRDDIQINLDCYNDGSNMISSTELGTFQIRKNLGRLQFMSACNMPNSNVITNELYPALTINSNSFIGIATRDADHRITVRAEQSNLLGPHMIFYINSDSNYPLTQYVNWDHNDIVTSYDAKFTGTNWISSSDTSFKLHKHNSQFVFYSACNAIPGDDITNNWHPAIAINSNSFIGIGTRDPTYKLTVRAEQANILGPHAIYYISPDSNHALYHQLNWDHESIHQGFDCYFNGTDWISSSANSFLLQKSDGRFNILNSCNVTAGDTITNNLFTAFSINSNSFIGIGTSNATHKITVIAEPDSYLGPHMAFYLNQDLNYPVTQYLNLKHDDASITFDAKFDPVGSNWISSSDTSFKIHKQNGQFVFYNTCNANPGDDISHNWHPSIAINSNSFIGIGTKDPTYKLTLRAEQSNILGPHAIYYISPDSNHALFHQLNWDHDSIHQGFDCYYDGNDWISSSETGSFIIQKSMGNLNILNTCNILPGGVITQDLFPAFSINSNSYIGIGTSNPTHRLTIQGPASNILGPHIATYLNDSNNPVFQIYSSNNDMISLNFDTWWNGYNYISSSPTANFQIIKRDGKLIFQSANPNLIGDIVDTTWTVGLTVNSNGYIGINNSNPMYPLDIHDDVIFRNNIIVAGNLIPGSNSDYDGANGGYDIGTNNMRFRDLYLSGKSIDMDNLVLRKDYYSGGLMVYDNTTSAPTRVWAKELLIGDPANLVNDKVYLITAESNGLHFQNVTSNIAPQDFSQLNNLFIGPMNLGIGISNAQKSLHIIGDYEQNPSRTAYVNWENNNVIRGNMQSLMGTPDQDNVNAWCGGLFSTQTSATLSSGTTQLYNASGLTGSGGTITYNGVTYIQLGYTSIAHAGLFELSAATLTGTSYPSAIYNPNSYPINVVIHSPYALNDSDSSVDTGYTWMYAINGQLHNTVLSAQESSFDLVLNAQNSIEIYAIPSSGSGTINSGFVFNFSIGWNVSSGTSGSGMPPIYCENSGYNNGSFIRFDKNTNLILTSPTNISPYANSGLSLLAACRFYDEITSNDNIITFSNSDSILSLNRDPNDPSKLVFKAKTNTNNITLISPANTIKQNEWALFSIDEIEVDSNIKMYKNGLEIASYTTTDLHIDDMSFSPGTESYIGGGNVDISTLYLFDRHLFEYEMSNLTDFIISSGRQSVQIKTRNQQYPPYEFTQDTSGWEVNSLISSNSVYSQNYSSTYYGNGNYKIWANTESTEGPAYNALYSSNTVSWMSEYSIYTTNGTSTGSFVPAGSNPITIPTLYMELPNDIVLASYSITANVDAAYQTPSEWKIYGSPNNIKWTLLDKQTAQTGWQANNTVLYNVNTIESYKYFKLETYKNDSILPTNIAISQWILYGSEYMSYLDGTGLGLGTALVKERFHVEGNGLITENLTIGEVNSIYIPNIKPYPKTAATNSNQIIDSQLYTYSANYNNNTAYQIFNNHNFTNTWIGTPGIYATNGAYNGAISTTTYTNTNALINTNTYFGDWVQIQMPDLIQLSSYTITPGVNPEKNAPTVIHIAGSKNGSKWYDVDTQYYTWLHTSGSVSFKVRDQATIGTYKYFRLIISKIGINTSVSQAEIAGLTLYGGILETSTQEKSLLEVKGDAHITRTINLTSKYYDKKQILNLDVKELVFNDTGLIESWHCMSQDNEYYRPIYYKTLGYRNGPYVNFVNKSMYSIPGTLNLQDTLGGFSMSTLIKFTDITATENIMTIYTSSYSTPRLVEVIRTGTNITFSVYNNAGTADNTISTTSSPIIINEWFTLGLRYTNAIMKSEIFINNTCIISGIGAVTTINTNYNQIIVGSWPSGLAPGGALSGSSMCIGGMYMWTRALLDAELFETSDLMMQGQPQLHIEDKARMSSGFEGGLTVYGTGYGTTICTYPPGDLNNNNGVIKNKLYGNGKYNVYSSSYYNLLDSSEPYNAFQSMNTNSWISQSTYSSGNYIGGEVILANNISYNGEWIQINLPEETIIQEYSITPDSYATNSPKTWSFLASKDGFNWVLLDTRTNYIFNNNNKLSFPIASNTISYMCYKIIISKIQTNLSTANVAINRIYLYGKTRESISTQDGTTVVFDKIGVNITNPAASLHVAGFSVLSGIKIISTGASNVTLPSYSGSSANVGMSNDNMGTNILMQNNTTNNYIRFLSANNEIARFTGTGNLGIGVQNPSYSLHLSTDSAAKPATATWTVSSDKRIKTDIQDANLDICYSNIKNIQLRRYTWLSNAQGPYNFSDRSQLGWIAQEIETVFPKSVTTIPLSTDGFVDFKMLNSDQIYASLFGCVQKLQKMNEDLEARIRVLENK